MRPDPRTTDTQNPDNKNETSDREQPVASPLNPEPKSADSSSSLGTDLAAESALPDAALTPDHAVTERTAAEDESDVRLIISTDDSAHD